MPHNMLMSERVSGGRTFPLTDAAKAELLRPTRCGGDDDRGMRCAGDIHRVITSSYQTPDGLRDRGANIVVFTIPIVAYQGVPISGVQLDAASGVDTSFIGLNRHGSDSTVERHLAKLVPASVMTTPGVATQIGGIVAKKSGGSEMTCTVKYSTTEPLHTSWGGVDESSAPQTRRTLLVRACNPGWGDQCGAWGLMSTVPHVRATSYLSLTHTPGSSAPIHCHGHPGTGTPPRC